MSLKTPAFVVIELDYWDSPSTDQLRLGDALVYELFGGGLRDYTRVPISQLASKVELYEQLYDVRRIDLTKPDDYPRLYRFPELLAVVRRINGRPKDYPIK